MYQSARPVERALLSLFLLAAALTVTGCSSFGRKFNQALPDFLRSDPGAEELERYQKRVRVLNRSEAEREQAKLAFDEAQAYHDAGEFKQAATALDAYLEAYPDTVDDKRARYLLIDSYMQLEEGSDARDAIKDFVAYYPISDFNDRIEEVTWTLAHEFLDGKHDFLFFSKEGDGIAMLRLVTTSFPNGIHADEAQWQLANFYFDERNYVEAMSAYAAIVERYPRSAWASRALYNQALCHRALAKGRVYDEVNMRKGVELFRQYLDRYPEGDRRAEAQEGIDFLTGLQAWKQVEVARWYLGQDQPLAARFFLLRCTKRWAGTEAAAEAEVMLADLPDVSEDAFFEELEGEIVDPERNEIPIDSGSTRPRSDGP
ncbi:MAG: outer membrane protein assembly factor BamD [Planctomycetes bacterium]|nr:outer membrane protein assembly factor BamD [Planctomycetota bacterium]